jgi:hypothetical protein
MDGVAEGGFGRRGRIGLVLALGVLVATVLATSATAREPRASAPLKGQWAFEVETAAGSFPMSVALRGAEQGGVLFTTAGSVEVEYRQDGPAFSIAAEIPGPASPTGSGQSLLLRGTQASERSATGSVVLIGDRPGENGAVRFEVISGTFTATRQ